MVTTFSLALGAACSTLMTICSPYWYIVTIVNLAWWCVPKWKLISMQVVCSRLCHVWFLPLSLVCGVVDPLLIAVIIVLEHEYLFLNSIFWSWIEIFPPFSGAQSPLQPWLRSLASTCSPPPSAPSPLSGVLLPSLVSSSYSGRLSWGHDDDHCNHWNQWWPSFITQALPLQGSLLTIQEAARSSLHLQNHHHIIIFLLIIIIFLIIIIIIKYAPRLLSTSRPPCLPYLRLSVWQPGQLLTSVSVIFQHHHHHRPHLMPPIFTPGLQRRGWALGTPRHLQKWRRSPKTKYSDIFLYVFFSLGNNI